MTDNAAISLWSKPPKKSARFHAVRAPLTTYAKHAFVSSIRTTGCSIGLDQAPPGVNGGADASPHGAMI